MNFDESIILNKYTKSANKQFSDMQGRLSGIESNFQSRMGGKTTTRLIGSFAGTIIWWVFFIACAVFFKDRVDKRMLLIALVIALGLILFMLIEEIMDFSYYSKILSHKNSVAYLLNRVNFGKESIRSNYDAFMSSRSSGWNYILNAAPSIPDEALFLETGIASLEALKKGFISNAKNFFYNATVIAITVVGCITLFPNGSSIVQGISGKSFSSNTLMTFNVIALIVSGICEIFFAKSAWSRTDCNVTNMTLFVMFLGPIMFIALLASVTWIIAFVASVMDAVIQFITTIVSIVVTCAFVYSCLCAD